MGANEGGSSVFSVALHGVLNHCFQSPFTVFLGNNVGIATLEKEPFHHDPEDVYHTVEDDEAFSLDLASRPPVPVPRPEASASGAHQVPDNEPYISKGKCAGNEAWGRGGGGIQGCSAGSP